MIPSTLKKCSVTFKKQPSSTGLASVGQPYQSVDIKINKQIIGYISAPDWRNTNNIWNIHLAINTENSWSWMRLKKYAKTEQEARDIAKNIIPRLKIDLHIFDED